VQALRHHRRRFSWFALIAIFALALVPTVSRWLAAEQGGSAWAEICTPQGMKSLLAAASGDEQPVPAKVAGIHLDHCALCGLAAQGAAPPTHVDTVALVPMLAERPTLFLHAPRPLFAWAAAQPRAPPIVRA
jgi:hypothetical protein